MSTTDLEVVRLLDAAKDRLGSDYKVAKVMGVPQQQVSEWRTGKRTCVAADRALLAGLAGEDALQELVRATLAKYDGTSRGDKLRQLLGNALPRIGGAAVSALLVLGSLTSWPTSSQAASSSTRYDEWKRRMRFA